MVFLDVAQVFDKIWCNLLLELYISEKILRTKCED